MAASNKHQWFRGFIFLMQEVWIRQSRASLPVPHCHQSPLAAFEMGLVLMLTRWLSPLGILAASRGKKEGRVKDKRDTSGPWKTHTVAYT